MSRVILQLTIFVATFNLLKTEYVSYKDFKAYKVMPHIDQDIEHLTKLDATHEFTFCKDVTKVGNDVNIMVDPKKTSKFEKYMENFNLKFKVVIDDVQSHIDEQLKRPINTRVGQHDWSYYQTLEEILDFMENIVRLFPNVASLVNIGQSYEGRPLRGIVIDFKKKEKPLIGMIEGGIHAREWISPATVTWIINEFMMSTYENIRLLAETFQWHIFPVTNPDGYVYSFTNDRMWRKNRNPANNVTTCSQSGKDDDLSNGVDLNRNFGYVWNTVGGSDWPCSLTYSGPGPLSELESLSIASYVLSLQQRGTLVYYIAFHSYGQWFMLPYSHLGGDEASEIINYADLHLIATKSTEKLKQRHNTTYIIIGTLVDILDAQFSGSSFDWVKSVGVPITYLIKLRDEEESSFLLPPDQIIPNNEEIMDALVEMDRVTRELGYYNSTGSGNIINISFWATSVILLKCLF